MAGNPGENLGELERLAKSSVWSLIVGVLDEKIAQQMTPPQIAGLSIDDIAIATISKSAMYQAFDWMRNRMLTEMIAREKKALAE